MNSALSDRVGHDGCLYSGGVFEGALRSLEVMKVDEKEWVSGSGRRWSFRRRCDGSLHLWRFLLEQSDT